MEELNTVLYNVFNKYSKIRLEIDIVLTPVYTKTPIHVGFRAISQNYEQKLNWPMAVGAVDGCHIPIN